MKKQYDLWDDLILLILVLYNSNTDNSFTLMSLFKISLKWKKLILTRQYKFRRIRYSKFDTHFIKLEIKKKA